MLKPEPNLITKRSTKLIRVPYVMTWSIQNWNRSRNRNQRSHAGKTKLTRPSKRNTEERNCRRSSMEKNCQTPTILAVAVVVVVPRGQDGASYTPVMSNARDQSRRHGGNGLSHLVVQTRNALVDSSRAIIAQDQVRRIIVNSNRATTLRAHKLMVDSRAMADHTLARRVTAGSSRTMADQALAPRLTASSSSGVVAYQALVHRVTAGVADQAQARISQGRNGK